jgi:CheY-like chemotaxis protein
VRLSVTDTGEGIAPAAQARIFQAFQQAQEGRVGPSTEGVGLGLTIAREIAHAMHSDIEVVSLPGRGARFTVEPLLPSAHPGESPEVAAELHARLPRRVLVAEDDEVNALIVHAFLDGLGVRSERVIDGKQAVGHALRETDRPELVLMDCRMPLMDGLSATAEIRRQERALGLPRLPILALTATITDAERRACLECGMDDVVGKPFTPEQLARAMREALLPRQAA